MMPVCPAAMIRQRSHGQCACVCTAPVGPWVVAPAGSKSPIEPAKVLDFLRSLEPLSPSSRLALRLPEHRFSLTFADHRVAASRCAVIRHSEEKVHVRPFSIVPFAFATNLPWLVLVLIFKESPLLNLGTVRGMFKMRTPAHRDATLCCRQSSPTEKEPHGWKDVFRWMRACRNVHIHIVRERVSRRMKTTLPSSLILRRFFTSDGTGAGPVRVWRLPIRATVTQDSPNGVGNTDA